MRITGISAQNYLSFGDTRFELSQLTPEQGRNRPTIVVGPNGTGKSNVLRVVKTLLEVVRNGSILSNLRDDVHRPLGDKKPIRLAMRVRFDVREWSAIASYWKLALASTEGLTGIAEVPHSNQESSRVNRVDQDQRQKFAEWILQNVADASLNYLAEGELAYKAEDPDAVPSNRQSTSLCFTFANGLTLNISDSTVSRGTPAHTFSVQHLARRVTERLPEAERASLALFLDGMSDGPLALSSHVFSVLTDVF